MDTELGIGGIKAVAEEGLEMPETMKWLQRTTDAKWT